MTMIFFKKSYQLYLNLKKNNHPLLCLGERNPLEQFSILQAAIWTNLPYKRVPPPK